MRKMVGVPPIQPRGVGTASQAVVPRQMGSCTTSRHDGPELEDAEGGRECIADNAAAREDQATQNLDGRSPGDLSLYFASLHRQAVDYAAAHERATRLIAEELWRMEQEDTLSPALGSGLACNLCGRDITNPCGHPGCDRGQNPTPNSPAHEHATSLDDCQVSLATSKQSPSKASVIGESQQNRRSEPC